MLGVVAAGSFLSRAGGLAGDRFGRSWCAGASSRCGWCRSLETEWWGDLLQWSGDPLHSMAEHGTQAAHVGCSGSASSVQMCTMRTSWGSVMILKRLEGLGKWIMRQSNILAH